MMVNVRGSVFRMVIWQWRYALVMAVAAVVAVVSDLYFEHGSNLLPALPLAIVGGALGIFVSFRTNSAYDRWWEGRKLWGGMVNVSRHFASQVLQYVGKEGPHAELAARIVRRHIAYVHTLRCLLRGQDAFEDEFVPQFLAADELAGMRHETNLTHALLDRQLRDLRGLVDQGALSELRMQSLDESLHEMLNHQGGCERIKKTPMPLVYGFLAHRLVIAFSLLFPFAVAHDLVWFTIPLNMLVGLGFALISEAGRVLEDPFSMFYNGLPLSALSTTIEYNLRNRLGETDLPPLPKPNDRGVLM